MSENEEQNKESIEKVAEKIAEIFIEHINFERANKSVVKKAVGAEWPQPAGTDDLHKNEP